MANRQDDDKVTANPTKTFFVYMITRDITLEDSILDLIDNSVDSAWETSGSPPITLSDGTDLSHYSISIDLSTSKFTIRDNCGGMSLDDAANYAFTFGRRNSQTQADYSIGVYGIGMKRAVFKLGRQIKIRSTFVDTDNSRYAFAVPIDVDNWLLNDDPPWDFDLDDDEYLDEDGVEIVVHDLNAGAATSFGNPAFVENLRRMIARDYSLHLNRGLQIKVNRKPISSAQIELRESDEFLPVRYEYVDRPNGHDVSVEIIGGMAAPPPEGSEPDETVDGDKRFGWYVACNGRIVLAADKSTVSGWGTPDWPQWHRQYSGFVGFVFFSSPNAAALPLTTTKRSVDVTSEVYLRARQKMRNVSKEWIAYTNARKFRLDEAKEKEEKAVPVAVQDVQKQQTITLPKFEPKPAQQYANVNYSVPLSKMKKLAKAFGRITMTYREVGKRSFDYAYDDLAEDD